MGETDPFSDTVFMGRLMKLLPMLGSEQGAEADAARRKLGEHLAQHRLTFLDMAQRLGGAGTLSMAARASLERQLSIARAAKEEAGREARAATAKLHALEVEMQQSTFNVARTLQGQSRFRSLAIAGWCVAVVMGAVAIGPAMVGLSALPRLPHEGQTAASDINTTGPVLMPNDPVQNDPSHHLQTGERAGRAAVQDLPIRLAPNDDATVRAFLNLGEKIAIEQEVHNKTQTWLLVRSATGTGWVRAGDVMH